MFQSADPNARDAEGTLIGRASACVMCAMLPTKPSTQAAQVVEIVDRIERLVAEVKAGFPLDLNAVTPLEAELIVYWRRYEDLRERQERQAFLKAMLMPRM